MKVYCLKDQGSYATWKATKDNGDYDRKTFEVKARPIAKIEDAPGNVFGNKVKSEEFNCFIK